MYKTFVFPLQEKQTNYEKGLGSWQHILKDLCSKEE